MGELKRLRKVEKALIRKIIRRDEAYERLLKRKLLAEKLANKAEAKFIAEVKLWRDKYDTLRELYDKLKELYTKLKNRS